MSWPSLHGHSANVTQTWSVLKLEYHSRKSLNLQKPTNLEYFGSNTETPGNYV